MDSDKTKSVIFVKKSDSKKGSLWNTLTNRRIIRQHGGFDIPENDLHAIHKYHSPLEAPPESEKENNETLSGIEQEIKQLKDKDDSIGSSGVQSFDVPKKPSEEDREI